MFQHAACRPTGGGEASTEWLEERKGKESKLYRTYDSLQTNLRFPRPRGNGGRRGRAAPEWRRENGPAILTGFADSPSGVHRGDFLLVPSHEVSKNMLFYNLSHT